MLQKGIASAEDIDKALKFGLNHPQGPFELVDLVGLDHLLHVLELSAPDWAREISPLPAAGAIGESWKVGPEVGTGSV